MKPTWLVKDDETGETRGPLSDEEWREFAIEIVALGAADDEELATARDEASDMSDEELAEALSQAGYTTEESD